MAVLAGDAESRSKPETETTVADADASRTILRELGYVIDIAFRKDCTNFRFHRAGYAMLATLVQVPELAGTDADGSFLEVETIVEHQNELELALAAIRAVLAELGLARADETTDTYSGAVRGVRRSLR